MWKDQLTYYPYCTCTTWHYKKGQGVPNELCLELARLPSLKLVLRVSLLPVRLILFLEWGEEGLRMGLPLTVEPRLGLSGFSSSEVYDRLSMLDFPVALRTILLGSV